MTNISETINQTLQEIGFSYLVAFYMPALLFTSLQFWLFAPSIVSIVPPELMPSIPNAPFLEEFVYISSTSLLFSVALFGLNSVIIRIYEGKFWFLKNVFLYPLTRYRMKQHESNYTEIVDLQAEYLRLSILVTEQSNENPLSLQQKIASISIQIKETHDRLEKEFQELLLPLNKKRIAPTRFGNIYAVSEEYAFIRYGMDSVLLWPRLRHSLANSDEVLDSRISQQKSLLDLNLNLSFVSLIITFQSLLFSRLSPENGNLFAIIFIIFCVLSYMFYLASSGALLNLTELVKMSFDQYRTNILSTFKLRQPENLIEEQIVWVRLSAFIRRGSPFYYPSEYSNISYEEDTALGSGVEDA